MECVLNQQQKTLVVVLIINIYKFTDQYFLFQVSSMSKFFKKRSVSSFVLLIEQKLNQQFGFQNKNGCIDLVNHITNVIVDKKKSIAVKYLQI